MRSRALVRLTSVGLLLATACGGAGYTTNRRHLSPESCPDAESLPSCEARLDGLAAALADALAPATAATQEPSTTQSAPAVDMEAPPESDKEEAERLARENGNKKGADCTSARDLRDRICDLSDAICALAARDGAPHEIMDKCTSARTSCEHARTEVSNACPKP